MKMLPEKQSFYEELITENNMMIFTIEVLLN